MKWPRALLAFAFGGGVAVADVPNAPQSGLWSPLPSGAMSIAELCESLGDDLAVSCEAVGDAPQSTLAVALAPSNFHLARDRPSGVRAHWTYHTAGAGRAATIQGALGPSARILNSLLVDGGYAEDNRQFADQIGQVRANINLRVETMTIRAVQSRAKLDTLTPRYKASLGALAAAGTAGLQTAQIVEDSARASLPVLRDQAANARSSVFMSLLDQTVISSLRDRSRVGEVESALSGGALRPAGGAIGGLLDEVRDESFGEVSPKGRRITQEARKLKAAYAQHDVRLSGAEAEAALIYSLSKLRLAKVLLGQGDTQGFEQALSSARSARYWATGQLKGALEITESGSYEVTYTTDLYRLAGTIWPTVVAENGTVDLGDWGLPSQVIRAQGSQLPAYETGSTMFEAPALPGDDSVDRNIEKSLQYIRNQAFRLRDNHVLTHETIPLGKFTWFLEHVNHRASWDYKWVNHSYAYAGNFNYGATGAALGIPLEMLLVGAGVAQRTAVTKPDPAWGAPFGPRPHGDDPRDQAAIQEGYIYFLQNRDRWRKLTEPLDLE